MFTWKWFQNAGFQNAGIVSWRSDFFYSNVFKSCSKIPLSEKIFFNEKISKYFWDFFQKKSLKKCGAIFFEILILEYWSVYQNLGQTRCGTGTRGAPAGTPGAPRWPETCATMDNVSKKMWHNIWDKMCDKFEQDLNKKSDKIWDGYTRDTYNIWNVF